MPLCKVVKREKYAGRRLAPGDVCDLPEDAATQLEAAGVVEVIGPRKVLNLPPAVLRNVERAPAGRALTPHSLSDAARRVPPGGRLIVKLPED